MYLKDTTQKITGFRIQIQSHSQAARLSVLSLSVRP